MHNFRTGLLGLVICLGLGILFLGFTTLVVGCGEGVPETTTTIAAASTSTTTTTTTTTTTLPAPASVTALADSLQVSLTWEAVPGAAAYNIYWANASGVTNKAVGTKIAGATSPYVHSSVVNGQTYYYIVVAEDSTSNEGAPSSQISATPQTVGTLDASFNTDGVVIHNGAAGGNSTDNGKSITTDSSGRILVAGYSRNASGNDDMVIWRYNSNGSLDTSFDSDGIVVHNNAAGGNGPDYGYSITTDSSGRILVAGSSRNAANNEDMVIWRYNANGTLDTSFDSDGIVVHNSAAGGNLVDCGNSITTDSSGRILVAGYSYNGANNDLVIWRYNANGTLDTSFDSDGVVVHDNAAGGNSHDIGNSITTDSSGNILVAGSSRNAAANKDMVIWRYNANGTLDTSFDSDGIVVQDNAAGGNSSDYGYSITTDSSGRILVAGNSDNSNDVDMVIWRCNSNGVLDNTFDTNGIVVNNGAAGGNNVDDEGSGIAIDALGRLVVTGFSTNISGNTDMVIWRYK